MKRKAAMIICVAIISVLAVLFVSGDSTIVRIGDEKITADDIEFARKNQEGLAQANIWDEPLTDQEIVKEYARDILLKEQYKHYNISLTSQEKDYADHYLANQESVLQDMLSSDVASVRDNAQTCISIMEDYMKAVGLNHAEYETLVSEGIANSILYGKLLDQVYNGDQDMLEAGLKLEMESYLDSGA